MALAEIFREEGIEKDIREERVKNTLKFLTKKFGPLPEQIRIDILKLNLVTLGILIDGIFEYQSLEDVKRYIK